MRWSHNLFAATAEEEVMVTMEEEVTVPVEQNVTEKKWWKEPKDKIISWMAARDKWLIEHGCYSNSNN